MAARPFAGDRVQVDEDGAGDVTAKVCIAALAAGQVPAEIDNPKILVRDVLMQPVWADQGTEVAQPDEVTTRVSWQKCTACGCKSCKRCRELVHASRSANWPRQRLRSAVSASR